MTAASAHRVRLAIALSGVFVACDRKDVGRDADFPNVLVSVGQGSIAAPDTIRPGWTRVRVSEDGRGHIVVIFRLPSTVSDSGVSAFLASLDTAATTPQPGVAVGGPEIGDVGEVIVLFTPGRYVLGCVRRGRDQHRHASGGEAKTLVVLPGAVDSTHAAAPRATQTQTMVDFAFAGPEKWTAGNHMIRVVNHGGQDHQLRLVRLHAGSSTKDWMDAKDRGTLATPIAGVARMGSGESAYLPVALSPGSYVAYCLVVDSKTRRAHVELGMFRSIQVE